MLVEVRVKKRGEASQDPGNLMVNTARPLYKLEVSCFFFLSPAKGNVVSTPHPLGILSLVARLCQAWHPSHWNERWLKKKLLFVCHTLSKECQRQHSPSNFLGLAQVLGLRFLIQLQKMNFVNLMLVFLKRFFFLLFSIINAISLSSTSLLNAELNYTLNFLL